MSEPKWTPGPWRFSSSNLLRVMRRGGDGVTICGVHRIGHHKGADGRTSIANGYLIAASPELAEAAALQEAAEDFHANCPECEGDIVGELCGVCFPLFDNARLKRRAALAKARGEL